MSPLAEPQRMSDEVEAEKHGVEECLWTNLGEGWFFTCLCGWQTNTDRSLSRAAEELEEHWKGVGATK